MPSLQPFHRRLCLPLLQALLLVLLVFALPCRAAEPSDAMVPLHVAAGTNLIHLARDYCRNRDDWKIIARINNLTDPYLIIEDTSLQVPLSLLLVDKLSATVASTHGAVSRVIDDHDGHDGQQTAPLNQGDTLAPGQTVVTGPDGYTHLLLPDRTYTRIEPDSQLTLNYLFRLKDGNVKADFFLGRGKVIHWVQDKLRANESFQTRTPIAITGIRGTEFRLKMTETTANTVETLRGRVEVSGLGRSTTIGPGQGVRVEAGQPPEQPRALPAPPARPTLEPLYRSLPVVIAAPAHPTAKFIRLRITADQQTQATLFNQSVAPGAKFTIGQLGDGAHFASLTAIDADNFESLVVGPLAFNVRTIPSTPVISSPKTGSTLWGKQGVIEWLESAQVDHYQLELATDAAFNHVIDRQQTTTARYTSPELQPGLYHFRVKAVAPDGFHTLHSIPVAWKLAPTPQLGGMEATANIRPTLQWPVMAEGWGYDLQVASDESFTTLVVDQQGLQTTSFTLEEQLVAGKYFVRIRGVENGQPTCPWTPPQTMTVKSKPLGWEELFFGVVTLGIILL